MAAPRPRRKRCDWCGRLVDVIHTFYGTVDGKSGRHSLCDFCHPAAQMSSTLRGSTPRI